MPMQCRPDDLRADSVTKAELAAMMETVLYVSDGRIRAELAKAFPGAYQRLTGASDATMAMLTHERIKVLREAGTEHVLKDATLNTAPNQRIVSAVLHDLNE